MGVRECHVRRAPVTWPPPQTISVCVPSITWLDLQTVSVCLELSSSGYHRTSTQKLPPSTCKSIGFRWCGFCILLSLLSCSSRSCIGIYLTGFESVLGYPSCAQAFERLVTIGGPLGMQLLISAAFEYGNDVWYLFCSHTSHAFREWYSKYALNLDIDQLFGAVFVFQRSSTDRTTHNATKYCICSITWLFTKL